MRHFQPRGPYMPPSSAPKIAVVGLTIAIEQSPEDADLPPLTIRTWCIGETPELALSNWQATAAKRFSGALVSSELLADPKARHHHAPRFTSNPI